MSDLSARQIFDRPPTYGECMSPLPTHFSGSYYNRDADCRYNTSCLDIESRNYNENFDDSNSRADCFYLVLGIEILAIIFTITNAVFFVLANNIQNGFKLFFATLNMLYLIMQLINACKKMKGNRSCLPRTIFIYGFSLQLVVFVCYTMEPWRTKFW